MNNTDKEYFRLLNTILNDGRIKHNRTGTNTIGVFGEQAKFKVDMDAFPILTTKKVWMKGIVHELLWFISGDTNIKYLVDNNVHIWDAWAYKRYKDTSISTLRHDELRTSFVWDNDHAPVNHEQLLLVHNGIIRHFTQEEFIEKIKTDDEFAAKWGELGEGTYGGMWRAFPVTHYKDAEELRKHAKIGDSITGTSDGRYVHFVDQLRNVVDKLKTNPDDRRMIISAWHPHWVNHCALPPCHCFLNFNSEELTIEERIEIAGQDKNDRAGAIAIDAYDKEGDFADALTEMGVPTRRLNLMMYIRSNDFFLGAPFNLTSYSLMIALMSRVTGMQPGVLTYNVGDAHIYENHLYQVKLQMTREPMKLPKLWLNPDIKSLFDFKYDDIKLIDYQSHGVIKGEVAV
jgi:thymidylate synthase